MAELKILIHVYRAQLLLTISRPSLAEKEVKAVLTIAPSNIYGIYYKAQISIKKHKYQRALDILSNCLDSCSSTHECLIMKICIYCSMGIIQSKLGQHNIACFCFGHALELAVDALKIPNNKIKSEVIF